MTNPTGTWITPTLAFCDRLSGLSAEARAQAFLDESAALNCSILTLRRNTSAARYAAQHAKSVGLRIEEVVAAALAIELLVRLERRDRNAAQPIRRAVFDGSISVRELRKRLKAVPERRPRGRLLGDDTAYALSLIEQTYEKALRGFTRENSDIAKLLRVDIEVTVEDDPEPHAIFISPSNEYSECAGLSIDDQIPFILAACLMYPRVNVAVSEKTEIERIVAACKQVRGDLPAQLWVVRLYGEDEDEAEFAAQSFMI